MGAGWRRGGNSEARQHNTRKSFRGVCHRGIPVPVGRLSPRDILEPLPAGEAEESVSGFFRMELAFLEGSSRPFRRRLWKSV